MRGYLDFDVEMENVGVFWSGTEALLLEYRWAILMLCHSVFFSFSSFDLKIFQPRTAATEREAEDVEERLGEVQTAAQGD